MVWGVVVNAAQPLWVVKTLNNIRRSVKAAKAAKNSTKALIILSKCQHALPENQIDDLAKIATKQNGLDEVGKILAKMKLVEQYGDDVGHIVLQDTYLRIAVKNGHITQEFASDTIQKLGGTPGLTALLRKINSTSVPQVKGHLRELEIALSANKRGFSTVSLGQKFSDGLKKGDTDLDVLLMRGKSLYAIESKAYVGPVPEDMVRSDALSLVAFCKHINNSTPVFCFESQPSLFTQKFLYKKGVKCIVGTPEEIATKLDFLSSIK
jgi:hypothetical protein